MKQFVGLLILISLICIPGCEKIDSVSMDEAKKIIMEYSPEAVITDCTLSEDSKNYEISFDTPYDSYVGTVNPKTGNIFSISVKEEEKADPSIFTEENPVTENDTSAVTPDSALATAINHSGIQGSAVLIQNELDEESNSYKIIFRSVNREYSYEIDANDGRILHSASYIDS